MALMGCRTQNPSILHYTDYKAFSLFVLDGSSTWLWHFSFRQNKEVNSVDISSRPNLCSCGLAVNFYEKIISVLIYSKVTENKFQKRDRKY